MKRFTPFLFVPLAALLLVACQDQPMEPDLVAVDAAAFHMHGDGPPAHAGPADRVTGGVQAVNDYYRAQVNLNVVHTGDYAADGEFRVKLREYDGYQWRVVGMLVMEPEMFTRLEPGHAIFHGPVIYASGDVYYDRVDDHLWVHIWDGATPGRDGDRIAWAWYGTDGWGDYEWDIVAGNLTIHIAEAKGHGRR